MASDDQALDTVLVLNFAHRTPLFGLLFPPISHMLVSLVIFTCTFDVCARRSVLSGLDTQATCSTMSHHHGSGALLTTAAGSCYATGETKETGVRVEPSSRPLSDIGSRGSGRA